MLRFQFSTVVFQLLNFFVLLILLTRFFYRPLQRLMRAREEEIVARIRNADERAERADREREALVAETRRARDEAETIVAHARAEASRLTAEFLERARQDAARLRDEEHRRVEAYERLAGERVAAEARHTAVTVAGSLIRKAAGETVHQGLVEALFARGLDMEGEDGAVLRRALARADGGVVVEIAYPPTPELESRLRDLLRRAVEESNVSLDIAVRVDPALLAGVRILVGTVAVDLTLKRTLEVLDAPSGAAETGV